MLLPGDNTLEITTYNLSISKEKLDELHALLKLSKLPPPTYEGQHRKFGITNAWMKNAKARWENGYDWRASEKKLNQFPQFLATVKNHDGLSYEIHFVGIFSESRDAIPLVLLHGWPGSWIEFQRILPILQKSTNPAFHLIVPSLPGYGVSSPPPLDRDFTVADVAYLMDQLMVGLGFGSENGGYYAQGGDIGRRVATRLGQAHSENCNAIHINMTPICERPPGVAEDDMDEIEAAALKRGMWWIDNGLAYAKMHGTRTSTIGHVLASNPLALLAWIGEKFLDWTDIDPTIDEILEFITLWWFTETFPRSIYPYRETNPTDSTRPDTMEEYEKMPIQTPTGFSWFPKEMLPTPRSWIEKSCDLVFFKRHERGGHFAAFEVPELLAADIVEWMGIVKK